jgi:hypothetical protein
MARFIIQGGVAQATRIGLRNIEDLQTDTADGTSYLGTPVYDRLIFQSGSYKTLNDETVNYDELIINTVLLTVNQSKNIVTTSLQGRTGTIKEYVSAGDYTIDIQGIISSDGVTYPEEEVNVLVSLLNAPTELRVTSNFLNFFNINDIVITDFTINQVRGVRNQQSFSISAISDRVINLEENQE